MTISITGVNWVNDDGKAPTLGSGADYSKLPRPPVKPVKAPSSAPTDVVGMSARDAFNAKIHDKGPLPPRPPQFAEPVVEPEPVVESAPQRYDTSPKAPRYVRAPQEPNVRFMRVGLPSNCVFYDFDDIQMRPFEVDDLAKLARSQAESNISILIDVMDGVINQNVRDLTVGDFYYLMYLVRIWSYPKSPYTLTWTSKYGNLNKYEITQSNLEVTECGMTRAEYEDWCDRGFQVPTVRDLEVFNTEELDAAFRWKYERAQYLQGDDLMDKVARLSTSGISVLEDIREFSKSLDHGVVETVVVRDTLFDPATWLTQLQSRCRETTDKRAEAELRRQCRDLEAKLRKGEQVVPDAETIRIGINLLTFFPDI